MLQRSHLHGYQARAAEFAAANLRSMLHLEMGLGKSVSTLTAIVDLFNAAQIRGVLVLGPRRVAETVWAQEAKKWAHTAHLRVCVLRGSPKKVLARNLVRPFDIWVINYEALPWLANAINQLFLSQGQYPPFDMLVFDEVTKVKNVEGSRVSNLYAANANGTRLIDYFPRRVGLTGTPAPNGYWDLFGQYFAVDDGRSLSNSPRVYKERFFYEDPATGRKTLKPGAEEQIHALISPTTLTMRGRDYLQLPDEVINDIWVDLPTKLQTEYNRFEATMFAQLDHGTLEVFNEASVTAKCRQIANGAVKDTETGGFHPVHDEKLEALDDILEESGGGNIFVSYVFRADMHRILARYGKRMRVEYLGPGVSDVEANTIINDWNAGKIRILVSNHQSSGHGLNIQLGGNQIVWFGLDWPLEGYQQVNARLTRQGQKAPTVVIHRLLTRYTIDEAVMGRLESKEKGQDDLTSSLLALQNYRDRKSTGDMKR